MSATAWGFFLGVYFIAALLTGVLDASLAGNSNLDTVLSFHVLTSTDIHFLFIEQRVPMINLSYFEAIAGLITLDSRFFDGDANLIRWFFLVLIGGPVSYVIITQLVPVLLNAIQTARGFFFGR